MQGTIIHYDELTRCGQLRDDTGQTHYFRREDLPENAVVADNQIVQVDVSEDNRLSVSPKYELPKPVAEPEPAVAKTAEFSPAEYTAPPTVTAPATRSGWLNWPGFLISLGAVVALLLAGDEPSHHVRGGRTPTLISSVWGMMAAVLLGLVAYLFGSGARRWLVRAIFWPIGLCSAMAFWMQSCDGFEGDKASEAYLYLLGALFIAAYLLPYRRK